MKTVAILMSGGVDSSLAAALLLEQGYEAVGITLKLVSRQETHSYGGCCAYSDAVDARRVAQKLGIPHYMLNVAEEFTEKVIQPFERAYRLGMTPNPCIECNRSIKFGLIYQKARQLGLDHVATGHYARIEERDGTFQLLRGVDEEKDQSYFLYGVGRERLSEILFPVGHLRKSESRRLADQYGLPVASKAESQDICFVPGGDYRDRIEGQPGTLQTRSGKVLGEHSGIEHFTVGQRKGIGLSGGPWYVLALDPKTRSVIVGERDEAFQKRLRARNAVWLEDVEPGRKVQAQIRYRHDPAPARIESIEGDGFSLAFSEPQWAIAPGQSAVLYESDRVLGGGIIESAAP